ncbi:MAG: hypothetical protein ACRC8S_08635 [Fimbriiglobus sp.]
MLKAALVYFSLVFGIGFLLGPIRVLILEPQVGGRIAELIEAPLMLTAILLAGRWISRRWCGGLETFPRLAVGSITSGLVLTADLGVGIGLRGMNVLEVFTNRDPVAGTVYYSLVFLTALTPWWFSRKFTDRV